MAQFRDLHTRWSIPWVVLGTLTVVVGTVLVGCSSSDASMALDDPSAGAHATADPSATAPSVIATPSTAAATTTTVRPPTGSGQPVTLAFAGDTNFHNHLGTLRSSPATVLSAIAPTLSAADLTMINLEAALGSGGTPAAKKFTFQVPEQAIDAVAAAGVDVVSMANNHGMDFGPVGFADSLRLKHERGFPILGMGADDLEAYSPWIAEVSGQRIGFLAANDVFDAALVQQWTAGPGHPGLASTEEAHQARFSEAVAALRPQVDTLVVFLHYGTETQTCPNQRQKDLVGLLTGAGADVVVGSHPHRLQGVGYHGEQFVAYSLGNFAFQANSPEGARSGVLTVTATGRRIDGYTWTPATIRNSLPIPDGGAQAEAAQAVMTERQQCAGLTPMADVPTGAVSTGAVSTGAVP